MDKAWVWVWPAEPVGACWPTCGSFHSLAAAEYKPGSAPCSQPHRSASLNGIKMSQSCIICLPKLIFCSGWLLDLHHGLNNQK